MSCRPAPACRSALDEATRLWPDRDRASDGICGDAAHANRVSDHNPDGEGYATAFDIDHDPGAGFDGFVWAERLRLRRDPRVKYVIFYGRMFASYATPSRPAWTWGTYTGPNAHKSHMHVSVLPSQKRVTAPWWFDAEQEDDDLTPEQDRMLRDLHAVWVTNRVNREGDKIGAAHDLATPVLATNGRMGWIQTAVERIVKKLQA